jgi:hypothetical protein
MSEMQLGSLQVRGRFQGVSATSSVNFSSGFKYPKV